MYGLIARVPLRGMIKKNVLKLMEGMYGPEGRTPDLGAESNAAADPLTRLALRGLPWLEKAGQWWDRVRRRR
jgi:hypothetical protein